MSTIAAAENTPVVAVISAVNGVETADQKIARLTAQLAAEAQENAVLRARVGSHGNSIGFKASEKGALSMYGLGKFPVTLYKSQWLRVIDAVKTGRIEQAIEQFGTALKEKSEK